MNPTLWTNLFLLKLLRFHLVDDVLKIFSFLFSVKIEYRSLGTKLSFICYIYKNEQFLRQNSELHFYFRTSYKDKLVGGLLLLISLYAIYS
ncbi:unnamed protein product [Oikopleura dioica]|uniref:Uncharacterized protein n=1 Tax=Oikopleura dioica TaxID=34765 RepID=E4YZ74_OIKDI|nr:unnamed protein product [Oikopleura dioica]